MATRFAVQYKGRVRQEFTAAQCHQAAQVVNHPGTKFFFVGKEVSAQDWFTLVYAAVDAAWDKKNLTHKRVKVLYGSSAACYIEKWVRR